MMNGTASRKRTREPVSVNAALVEIYEDLAHEDQTIRLSAAHRLLRSHLATADRSHLQEVLKRLFRGLCSNRKAARVGFALVLTEVLSQLSSSKPFGSPENVFSGAEIIDLLESNTVAEYGMRGQDERDHYYGKVFGIEAIIKSEFLFKKHDFEQWQRLLSVMCGVAIKKPWLRQLCGWALYDSSFTYLADNQMQNFAVAILDVMNQHKLIRTPEGLAIWIKIQQQFPKLKLPQNVWKKHNPLLKVNRSILSESLRNAKATSKSESDFEAQGSAMWDTAEPHFAWIMVGNVLLQPSKDKEQLSFDEFWLTAVDGGLLAPSNSKEQKHWGLRLLYKFLRSAPANMVGSCLSKNAVGCLIQSLDTNDGYLTRDAKTVVEQLVSVAEQDPAKAGPFVVNILRSSGYADFDLITKTKTIHNLVGKCTTEHASEFAGILCDSMTELDAGDSEQADKHRRIMVNTQHRFMSSQISASRQSQEFLHRISIDTILGQWIANLNHRNQHLDPSESVKSQIREKMSLIFEDLLKLEQPGRRLMLESIQRLFSEANLSELSAEQDVLELVKSGWKRFQSLLAQAYKDNKDRKEHPAANGNRVRPNNQANELSHQGQLAEGLALLYGLILFQAHGKDTEAVTILGDLLDFEAESSGKKSTKSKKVTLENADGLVEILLSFASKPSKFLRRITMNIFETFTSQITQQGLESLIEILSVKETKEGQQELFEPTAGEEDEEDEDESEDEDSNDDASEKDSDVEMLDSDVELVDAPEEESNEDSSASSSDAGSESDADESKDAELVALESSLAKALGTRKLTTSDMPASSSESDSDSDMTDSEMLALDSKLSEVFRARSTTLSSSNTKRKENKQAKENIINFKNRVLDLIETYIRLEHGNARALDLVVPLLTLARKTGTKQLATKSLGVLADYCRRCKGLARIPILPFTKLHSDNDEDDNSDDNSEEVEEDLSTQHTLQTFQKIHTEMRSPNTSNAHKSSCSQASILLAKVLFKNNVPLKRLENIYAETKSIVLPSFSSSTTTTISGEMGEVVGHEGDRGKSGRNRKRGKQKKKGGSAGMEGDGDASGGAAGVSGGEQRKANEEFFVNWEVWVRSVGGRK